MERDVARLLGRGAVVLASDPYHVARCDKLVKHARMVVPHPNWKHRGLPDERVEEHAFQLLDDAHEAVDALIPFRADWTDALSVEQKRLV